LFVKSTSINKILSVLFIVSVGACGNFGSCAACGATGPLPAGGLPGNQTVEGGGQIRVTPSGFTKLTSILPGVINSGFANGMCIAQGSVGGSVLGANYCNTNGGGACGAGHGCNVTIGVHPGSFSLSAVGGTFHFAIGLDVHTVVHLDGHAIGFTVGSCDMNVDGNNIAISADIAFGITPSNGELNIHVAQINNFDSSGLNLSNCGIISTLGNLINDVLNSFIGQFAIQLLTPVIDNLVQGFLPSPLGIASMTDLGNLLGGVSPGTQALLETRMVPGGYVSLTGNGLNLGLITGLNSDENPLTRTGIRPDGVPFVSEPARCVPPIPAPDFAAPPYSLPTVARSALTNGPAFTLMPAGQFTGAPDPAADIAMGISATTLDQVGHHLVTSGGMCLGVGTSFINQLNVGTISILVPSLGDLQSDKGNDPLLLVTRPQKAIDFTIGDNTMASPAITIGISHMEVDFYAFLYERYVRAFTMDLTMNVGVNLEFEQTGTGPAMIKPTLVGISSQSVTVHVLNSDFVKETPAHLEMVLPSVFDLVTPLLGNIAPIQVPQFAGFSLNNLSIQHVTTSQDDFLALYASLGAGFMARQLAQHDQFALDAVNAMDAALPVMQTQSTGTARLVGVKTPDAAVVRSALYKEPGGALPSVTFDVDRYDSLGRELEWSWNFNGGIWHAYQQAFPLVITDRAFAWQGKYTIGLQSRVKGDYRTTSAVIETPVVIDSVGPKVFGDKASWKNDQMIVPVWDVVGGEDVQVAYGRPGDDKPLTNWVYQGDASLARQTFDGLQVNGEVAVFAKDALGNQTIALVSPFHGQSGSTGCTCETGRPGAGGLVLFGIVGFVVLRRRRRWRLSPRTLRVVTTVGIWFGVSAVVSLSPGCSCGKKGESCETAADCGDCPKGQLPFCIDNTCVCSDDIPLGHVGPYSDVAAGPDGTIWVSAYAQSHGDLVVAQATGGRIPDEAWEWVDGVPDGPVVVPDSMIRRGIADDGADVGMYTSIAVAPDGTPMVSYFDVDRGALKFAAKIGGAWQITDVDLGTGGIDNVGGSVVGMYTSLSLRSDDGRPGIAYLAHTHDATGEHAEVRYASAQTTAPTGPGDWQTWVVDTGIVPPADPNNPNIYPLPEGLGLFIDSTRNPTNQAPVVAYYDRGTGDLKVSKFNTSTGNFAAPLVLDGSGNIDAGWSPSVQVDAAGKVNVAYVSATTDDLKYVVEGSMPEVIDDGYRIVGTTVDGLPKPEFHFVGDDAGLVLPSSGGPLVVYQDATTQELLLAQRQPMGGWTHVSVAGATQPWPGAYGFFAADALRPTDIVMSSWVIDQPTGENWVEVFTKPTIIQ